MKTKPSHYVLVAEILIITLFHAAKIRNTVKPSPEIVFTPIIKTVTLHKPIIENNAVMTEMLIHLIK
jgi:hypothetical protein